MMAEGVVVFNTQEEVEVETQPPPKAKHATEKACGGVTNGDIQRGGR